MVVYAVCIIAGMGGDCNGNIAFFCGKDNGNLEFILQYSPIRDMLKKMEN